MFDLEALEWKLTDEFMPGVLEASMWAKLPENTTRFVVGIDPGKHFGVAVICGRLVAMGYGSFDPHIKMYQAGIAAFNLSIGPTWKTGRLFGKDHLLTADTLVVEGPSYGSVFGEANLMAVRMGFALAPLRFGSPPALLVPPASARLAATGHGRAEVMDVLKEHLPPMEGRTPWKKWEEATDALGCAIYGLLTTPPTK